MLQSLLKLVKKYDEAGLTWDQLVDEMRADISITINKTYDFAFAHGVTAQVEDEDEESEEMQLEFDLDELRQMGEETDEEE